MSKSRKDQRLHRRKAWVRGTGVQEHAKRERRRKRNKYAAAKAATPVGQLLGVSTPTRENAPSGEGSGL